MGKKCVLYEGRCACGCVHAGNGSRHSESPDAVVRQRILFWFPLLFLVGERSPACYFALLASISSSVTLASSK